MYRAPSDLRTVADIAPWPDNGYHAPTYDTSPAERETDIGLRSIAAYVIAADCDACYSGTDLCPGGPHPFGSCGYRDECEHCGRKGTDR
jgi:hypothetical protein